MHKKTKVGVSFGQPSATAQITGISVLNFLEVIRPVNPKIRLCQTPSSEIFGNVQTILPVTDTPIYSSTPYVAPATGRTETLGDFVRMAIKTVGVELEFKGLGDSEYAVIAALASIFSEEGWRLRVGKSVLRVNPGLYRQAGVELLIGNLAKVKTQLGWEPMTELGRLLQMMIAMGLRRNTEGFLF